MISGLLLFSSAALRADAPAPPPWPKVLCGIDVLESEHFAPLVGKQVGLITNQTGLDAHGRSTADILARAPGVKLIALFSRNTAFAAIGSPGR